MATLIEIQGKLFENILLNRQLTPPQPGVNPVNPQADCGRQVEQILEAEYFAEDKQLNGYYPTFSTGVDVQSPTCNWEIKTRQLGSTSRVNIGAISTQELDICQKHNLTFDQTDFSHYACCHLWSFYNKLYKIVSVESHDFGYHRDLYEKAYEILKNTADVENKKYISVLNSEMIWERPSTTATQWSLRVTERELVKLFQGCKGQKVLENNGIVFE